MKFSKSLIVLISVLVFCAKAYSHQKTIVVQNNCTVSQKIAIYTNSNDSIVQTIKPGTEVKIKYNSDNYDTAKLFFEGERYSLLPQKKGNLSINCKDKSMITFVDAQNKIYNEAYLKARTLRREANKYTQQMFSDSSLSNHQKDSMWNGITLLRENADAMIFNHFVLNAPGFASLMQLSSLVSYKNTENTEKIEELYRLNQSDKVIGKSKFMKAIERKMTIPKIELGTTMASFQVSEKHAIPLSKGKHLLYYASENCHFCNEEMKYLDSLNEQLADVKIIILGKISSKKYTEMCKNNDWTFYTESDLLQKDITYSLGIKAYPTGILIIDNILKKTDFRIERDKHLIGL